MKKEYTKPQVFIESFVLSTSLATNCEKPFNHHAQFSCGIPNENMPGMKIFSMDVSGDCDVHGDSEFDVDNDGFCYHVPTEDQQLFNS